MNDVTAPPVDAASAERLRRHHARRHVLGRVGLYLAAAVMLFGTVLLLLLKLVERRDAETATSDPERAPA